MELELAYNHLTKQDGISVLRQGHSKIHAFFGALDHVSTFSDVSKNKIDSDLLRISEIGNSYRKAWSGSKPTFIFRPEPRFKEALSRAIATAKNNLSQRFSDALQKTQSSLTRLIDQAVKDMSYALDIKAEGNLLFALLTAAADSNSQERVSTLQDRFKRSLDTFLISANEFLKSELSLRNPILAGNVKNIEGQLQELGKGSNNLFSIRRELLTTTSEIELLLSTSREIAAKLNLQIEDLVNDVQSQASILSKQLERNRGAYRTFLVLVFSLGLILLFLIALYSIRTMVKQDRDLRQAAMVFESTNESIIITDEKARIIAANQAFLESFQYNRDDIIGHHARILRSKHHHISFYKEMLNTLSRKGRWQGEIYTRKKSGSSNPEWLTVNSIKDSRGDLSQYVAVFSDVAIIKRSLQQLDHLAHHDTLTGLPNRLLLQDRLNHAIHRARRNNRRLALLFLDVDRFKNINDTLGHTAGDRLLVLLATRLSALIREGDTVARLGGDEFMILMEDYKATEDAHIVANKVLKSMDKAFTVQDQELFVTTSIGISLYPEDGVTVDKLIRNSDTAMYKAKNKGRNNYQFYTSELTAIAIENLRLESSLRLGLERQEFQLHYQPKWNTKTQEITGVEALLRWHHPERGLIGPDNFLNTLEDCGLMIPVGKWLLLTACQQARTWREQGLPAIQMSVNLSGQEILSGDLLNTVIESLEKSRFDPRYLELEITEGFIMQQPGEVIEFLNSLRTMGVSFAIDDFGTGHSSLSYLKQLPVQKLKIDRSFIQDIPHDSNDMAITSAIVALGHRLQMSIVAEGVDTKEQLEFLVNEGCEEAQGYLFSQPLPAEELEPLLQQGELRQIV
jgi:diguanylate cyclase (GGDEF)-like protein/PAS domain S-box-containing protein